MSSTTIFISYAQDDEDYFQLFTKELKKHTINSKKVEWDTWTDQDILIGSDWNKAIQDKVEACDFALLLVSASFMSSEYIKNKEFSKFVNRKTTDGFLFLPIMISPCDITTWQGLAEMQFFYPKGGKYNLPKLKNLTYSHLVKFDDDRLPMPNPYRQQYMIDLVKALENSILENQKKQAPKKSNNLQTSIEPRINIENIVFDKDVKLRDLNFFESEGNYLTHIENLLNNTEVIPILGMTGVGKTYLAYKIAYRQLQNEENKYNIIWFINSENPDTILRDLKELSDKLGLPNEDDDTIFIESLKKFLHESNLNWLLIFDNVCDRGKNKDLLSFKLQYFPPTQKGKQILLTSQNILWTKPPLNYKGIPIEAWTLNDYKEFLKKEGVGFLEEEIQLIHDFFGGLPLAIRQAVNYIIINDITLKRYIYELTNHKEQLLEEGIDTLYKGDLSVLSAISLSFYDTNKKSNILLSILSFLFPDNIPLGLISKKIEKNIKGKNLKFFSDNPLVDSVECTKATGELINYSLIKKTGEETISIHRLTKEVVQILLKQDKELYLKFVKEVINIIESDSDIYIRYMKEVLNVLNHTFDFEGKLGTDISRNLQYFSLIPHLNSVIELYKGVNKHLKGIDKAEFVELLYKKGYYEYRIGRLSNSLQTLRDAKEVNLEELNPKTEIGINILLADNLLTQDSTRQDAKNYLLEALRIAETHNLDEELGDVLGELGYIVYREGDYLLALEYIEKALKVRKDKSETYYFCGLVHMDMGNFDLALSNFKLSLPNEHTSKIYIGIIHGLKGDSLTQYKNHFDSHIFFSQNNEAKLNSYALYNLICFDLDRKDKERVDEYFKEFNKYSSFLEGHYKHEPQKLILKFRLAISNDKYWETQSIFEEMKTSIEVFKKFPLEMLPTSAFLDFAEYMFSKDKGKAKEAIRIGEDLIGNYTYHRRNELNLLKSKLNDTPSV